MKVNWLFALATVIVASLTGSATIVRAQTYTISDGDTPAQFASMGCDSCGNVSDCCGCNDGGCDACACDDGCGDDEPIRLFPELPGGITITGWVDSGGTANADNPASNYNGTLTFNDRQEIQLNQLYVVVQRETDTTCQSLDIGGRVDLLFGTDYIFTQAVGLETERDGSPKWNNRSHYGLALPQMYLEVAYNDLSVKIGHFYTIIGYEVVTAPDNFFYSHAYTMQYGEPFTHTGILTSYALTDQITTFNGIHSGWDNFDSVSQRAAYLGGTTWTSSDEQISLASTVSTGDEFNDNGVYSNRTIYSLVGQLQLTENLRYVIQHDNGWHSDFFAPNVDAEWYGLNQYMFYTINDKWSAGVRGEWFRDDDGVRVAGVRANNPANVGGFEGNFYEISLGLNWIPNANVKVRPEVRWDWYDGNGNGQGQLPFDDLTKDNQFTAAMDAILLW